MELGGQRYAVENRQYREEWKREQGDIQERLYRIPFIIIMVIILTVVIFVLQKISIGQQRQFFVIHRENNV